MHLEPEYWVEQTERPDELLGDTDAVNALNRFAFDNDPFMVDLAAYAEVLERDAVIERIRDISKPSSYELYYRDGGTVGDEEYARYGENLDLDAIDDTVPVRFGLVLERADMRRWPTKDVVFKNRETFDLDRFQENGLFPADVVAILHESADGDWYFAQSYNYGAWVEKDKVVIGDRDEILEYRDSPEFLVVTGSKVTTNFNPYVSAISELQLDMGVRLPLVDPDDVDHDVDGQNPYASYAVRLPVRGENGELEFRVALIARSQDVHVGYLPFTRQSIIEQSFKFLGERYGWGHSYNARDCTGLVSEVYKTVGILMPRNSGQQGESPIGETVRFGPDDSEEKKLRAVAEADVGDLLYSPGHVMMYLGSVDGEPYVIHDLSGSGWIGEDGKHHKGVLNGVSVTPLTTIHMSREFTYFEKMYAIKQIR
jgi:cell wall-associated NlpC family hydrolase